MSKCLLCDAELTSSTKPEHVLLNCLGGRKTTTQAICSTCNEQLGSSIDDALCESVAEIRNYLNLQKGDGSPPPLVRRNDPKHGPVVLLPGGIPVKRKITFDVNEVGGGYDINLLVGDEEKLRELVPHIAKRLRISEEEALETLRSSNPEVRNDFLTAVHQRVAFGSDEAQRSMAKMCLVLLGARKGSRTLAAWNIEKTVAFINDGSNKDEVLVGFQTKPLPNRSDLEKRFGLFFNALILRTTSTGKAYGYFRLYNGLAWIFKIADAGPNLEETFVLVSDPQKPSNWAEEDFGASLISNEFFCKPDYNGVEDQGRALISRVMTTHIRTAQRKILKDSFDEIVFNELGLEPDQALTADQVETIAGRLSEYLTLQLLRIPNTRKFNLE